MIRQIAHIILFCFLCSSTIYSQWIQQNPRFITNNSLESVYFVNELTGYIAGWNGTIIKTEDGGINWEVQNSGINDYLWTIHFIDDQIGFAGGNQFFLKTTNGGLAWFPILTNYNTVIKEIISTDNNTLYAVGLEGSIGAVFKSTDLGNNWNIIYNSNFSWFNCIYFLDSNTGYVSDGRIHKTTDGGNSWTIIDSTLRSANSIYFLDHSNGFLGGDNIYKTTDGGSTWNYSIVFDSEEYARDIKFVSLETGFALSWFSWEFGEYATLYKTTNAGLDWQSSNFGYDAMMASLYFTNENEGYSVGTGGKILKTINGGISWYRPNAITSSRLNSVDKTENEIVYIAGNSGTLLKSINGGDAWFPLVSGTTNSLTDIEFINSNLGYCVGYGGTILETTDGGLTWFPQISGTTENLYCIFIVDANNLYIGGTNGIILKSIDGGEEWIIQNSGVANTIVDLQFLNHDIGIACGNGFVIKSIDGGTNWIQMDTGGIQDDWFSSVYFQNPNVGYITGGYVAPEFSTGEIWKTNDGGNNWIRIYGGGAYFLDMVFLSENLGFVVGVHGLILKTTNTGSEWLSEDTPTNYSLYDIDFSTPIGGYVDGFVVGQDGMILKREIISSVKQDENFITNYNLSQNYPNPFNPTTSIQYAVSSRQFVSLKVYDILGREVATLVNEEKPAGNYEVEFTGSDLTSGSYFYQLKAGDYVETKKMVLIK